MRRDSARSTYVLGSLVETVGHQRADNRSLVMVVVETSAD